MSVTSHRERTSCDEAVSPQVSAHAQDEVDRYPERLTAAGGGEIGPCGWVKDRFGLPSLPAGGFQNAIDLDFVSR